MTPSRKRVKGILANQRESLSRRARRPGSPGGSRRIKGVQNHKKNNGPQNPSRIIRKIMVPGRGNGGLRLNTGGNPKKGAYPKSTPSVLKDLYLRKRTRRPSKECGNACKGGKMVSPETVLHHQAHLIGKKSGFEELRKKSVLKRQPFGGTRWKTGFRGKKHAGPRPFALGIRCARTTLRGHKKEVTSRGKRTGEVEVRRGIFAPD